MGATPSALLIRNALTAEEAKDAEERLEQEQFWCQNHSLLMTYHSNYRR